jgi:hypothetical protein
MEMQMMDKAKSEYKGDEINRLQRRRIHGHRRWRGEVRYMPPPPTMVSKKY